MSNYAGVVSNYAVVVSNYAFRIATWCGTSRPQARNTEGGEVGPQRERNRRTQAEADDVGPALIAASERTAATRAASAHDLPMRDAQQYVHRSRRVVFPGAGRPDGPAAERP